MERSADRGARVLPAEAFDRLAAELEEPPRLIPEVQALIWKHRGDGEVTG